MCCNSQVGYRAEVSGGELVRSCLCPVSFRYPALPYLMEKGLVNVDNVRVNGTLNCSTLIPEIY